MRNTIICRVAVVVMAICSLAACKKTPVVSFLEVSVKSQQVGSQAGQQFVSVKASGSWSLSLQSDGAPADWASLAKVTGSGSVNSIVLSYDANGAEQSRTLEIIADDGTRIAKCSMTQEGTVKTEDPKPQPTPVSTAWLELPSMDDSSLDYFSYRFNMGGKSYRNYTIGYSKENYLSQWVAYPINNVYTSGSYKGEGEDWDWNPDIDHLYQPDFDKSFGFTRGYERGHQIANADRKCSREANLQTFYFTNSTLQHKEFNGKIWATLEGNLRNVPKTASDTVYVVTGCVVSKDPDYIPDPSGKMVPVPSAYFKAALSYTKSSTLGTWRGAGFYLEHKTYSYENITSAETMTIDALEEKLGMDFFVNLPSLIGETDAAAIEAQNPMNYASVWGIK